jgi:DNA end-binding protein Ku
MAKMLVENLAAEWSPDKYTDDYRQNLMKVIKAKLKGKKPKLEEEVEPRSAQVVDLMERLRQSLEGGRAKGAGGTKRPAAGRSMRPKRTTRAGSKRKTHAA